MLSPVEPNDSHMAPSLTTITLNKSTWKLFQSKINSALKELSGSATVDEFVHALAEIVNSKEISVVGKRSAATDSSLTTLLDEFKLSPFAQLLQVQDTIDGLFVMALFAPNGPFNSFIPKPIKSQVMESILATLSNSALTTEMTVLQQQLTALGDCCTQETEQSCACGSTKGCS